MLDNAQDVNAQSPGQETPEERTYKESELNDIVGKKKHHAYLKGKQDALAELQQPQQQNDASQTHAYAGLSADQVRQAVQNEMQKAQETQFHNQMHNEFYNRVAAGVDKHPDFREVIQPFLLDNKVHPDIVALANTVDNTSDVIYDLAKNPMKVASLLTLSSNPMTHHLALTAMHSLSSSIKNNEAAKNIKQPPEPSTQLSSSYTGSDNGSYTMNDMRKMDWLKG